MYVRPMSIFIFYMCMFIYLHMFLDMITFMSLFLVLFLLMFMLMLQEHVQGHGHGTDIGPRHSLTLADIDMDDCMGMEAGSGTDMDMDMDTFTTYKHKYLTKRVVANIFLGIGQNIFLNINSLCFQLNLTKSM